MIRLRVLEGPNKGAALDVVEDQVMIGSDAERCSVLLLDRAVRPLHVTIVRVSDDEMTLETADDATISLDGQAVPPGLYATGSVVLLAIGRHEILVQCRAPTPADETEAETTEAPETDPTEAAPAHHVPDPLAPPPKKRRWPGPALLVLALIGLTWFFMRLIQNTETPASSARTDTARAPAATAPTDTPHPFDALKPHAPPSVPPTKPPDTESAFSYDPDPATHASNMTRLESGTVLFEPATPPAPPPPKIPQRTLRRFVDDPDGLIVETTDGARFLLKTDRRDGYAMRWLSDDQIELQRGTQTLHIKVE